MQYILSFIEFLSFSPIEGSWISSIEGSWIKYLIRIPKIVSSEHIKYTTKNKDRAESNTSVLHGYSHA